MALETTRDLAQNDFYREHYHHVLMVLMLLIMLTIAGAAFVLYQLLHRPFPPFTAMQPDRQQLVLKAYTTPNLLAPTIIRWASQAAVAAYTFQFDNYQNALAPIKTYFTETGWQNYLRSVNPLLKTIAQNNLIVSSVVAGTPIISNQGDIPDQGYTWRLQIPLLVSYQTANTINSAQYIVLLTVVRVPTVQNPQGMGVDQFVMVSR